MGDPQGTETEIVYAGTVVATGADRRVASDAGDGRDDERTATERAHDALKELARSGRLSGGELWELALAWTAGLKSPHTTRAYREAIKAWLSWCDAVRRIDSLRATWIDAEAYDAHLTNDPSPRTGLPIADTSRKARLSALSSWYRRLAKLQLVTAGNPFDAELVERPHVDQDYSPTIGLSAAEGAALMRAARADTGPQAKRTVALIAVLITCGPRVAELVDADAADLTADAGHRVLPLTGKSGKKRRAVLAPWVARDVDDYLAGRTDRPLFMTSTGRRMDQAAVWRLVRRLARAAGITAWDQLSPHSLRHTAITIALDNGASLRDVQDMAGHANPRTTRRYDRDRGRLDRSPTYAIAAALGGQI